MTTKMPIPNPAFIMIASHDGGDPTRPMVWEQYLDLATREHAQKLAANCEKRYGPCIVARIVFDGTPEAEWLARMPKPTST